MRVHMGVEERIEVYENDSDEEELQVSVCTWLKPKAGKHQYHDVIVKRAEVTTFADLLEVCANKVEHFNQLRHPKFVHKVYYTVARSKDISIACPQDDIPNDWWDEYRGRKPTIGVQTRKQKRVRPVAPSDAVPCFTHICVHVCVHVHFHCSCTEEHVRWRRRRQEHSAVVREAPV